MAGRHLVRFGLLGYRYSRALLSSLRLPIQNFDQYAGTTESYTLASIVQLLLQADPSELPSQDHPSVNIWYTQGFFQENFEHRYV